MFVSVVMVENIISYSILTLLKSNLSCRFGVAHLPGNTKSGIASPTTQATRAAMRTTPNMFMLKQLLKA